ncbi:hypothetical protein MKW98_015108 [Papaver atlanticum]|uniref:Uncharacterized protein n=1 Tax=Papaver atlanticum TaxID=357466 RepID=A0AAD4XAF1_9MAGN|nr:hypothetical protein MKW98_015108 [Papaver atlanticum]
MKESTKTNFAFLVFAGIVGFSFMLHVTSLAAAALSCDPSTEVYVGGTKTTFRDTGELCRDCWSNIQTLCTSKERLVSKIEWNRVPFEPDLSFNSPMTNPENCDVCINGCKTRCDTRNGTVFRETCRFLSDARGRYYYGCNCCCRPTPPPPPPPSPPPPSPPPSPPPPTPSPPPPSPPPPSEPICDTGDIYLPFQLPSTRDCDQCKNDCKTKCSERDNCTGEYEVCNKTSTAVFCDCCCMTS